MGVTLFCVVMIPEPVWTWFWGDYSLSLPGVETQSSILRASVVRLTASNFTDWLVMNNILLYIVMVVLFGISNSQTAADRSNNEAVTYPISLFSRVSILAFRALVSFLSRRTRITGKSWYAQFSLFTWLSWWTSFSSRPLKTLSKKMLLPTEQVKTSAGIYLPSLSFSLQCCWTCGYSGMLCRVDWQIITEYLKGRIAFETSVDYYQSTRRNFLQSSSL